MQEWINKVLSLLIERIVMHASIVNCTTSLMFAISP